MRMQCAWSLRGARNSGSGVAICGIACITKAFEKVESVVDTFVRHAPKSEDICANSLFMLLILTTAENQRQVLYYFDSRCTISLCSLCGLLRGNPYFVLLSKCNGRKILAIPHCAAVALFDVLHNCATSLLPQLRQCTAR